MTAAARVAVVVMGLASACTTTHYGRVVVDVQQGPDGRVYVETCKLDGRYGGMATGYATELQRRDCVVRPLPTQDECKTAPQTRGCHTNDDEEE